MLKFTIVIKKVDRAKTNWFLSLKGILATNNYCEEYLKTYTD